VTPGQDGDRGPAEPPGGAAAGPPDHARAETYLRLRAETELRRVQALPRPDPGEPGLPGPLGGAARVVLPPGRRAAGIVLPLAGQAARALQPLAENTTRALHPLADRAGRTLPPLAGSTARALQPLADRAGRTLPPLAGDIARALQPLADQAARALQPLAAQVIGAVLPVADQAARRLHPLAWEAGYRLQALPGSAAYRLRRRRGRDYRAAAPLRSRRAAGIPSRWEPMADETPAGGLHRLRALAHALVQANAIERDTADSVLDDLETALAARSRIDAHLLFMRYVHAGRHRQPPRAPTGPYLATPVGVTTGAPPDSGLAAVHLLTLVTAPDRVALNVVGRWFERGDRSPYQAPWFLLYGADPPEVTDDRGNSYQIQEDSGWSDGEGNWGGILDIVPVPPAGIRWLALCLSPGSPPVQVNLADARGEGEAASGPVPAGSPVERLIDAAALDLLHAAVTDDGAPWPDLSGIADLVTALDGVGTLEPARSAVGRLVTLAGRLGVDVSPVLHAAAPPGDLLPAAWTNVLQNRHRHDGPCDVSPAAAVLPELDGARFVLAGLRSDVAGADLDVLGWGLRVGPHPLEDSGVRQWSWSARDSQGRWHVADEGHFSGSDHHADMRLRLVPPLQPEATSLEVTLVGRSGQVTATVPLDWLGRR
jgi:hypothetical protein